MWVGFNGIKAAAYLEAAGLLGKVVTTKCSNTPIIFSCIQQMIMYRQLTLPKEERYDYPYQIYVDQAVDYIQRNFKSNIKVNDLASYIGIDRSYLTNIFKKVTTLSPQEYLMNYRMEQAKNMLSGSEMKIGEIAEKVGYHDQLTFSKMFKKFVGISPTEYREKE